jgi:hypothetical protein
MLEPMAAILRAKDDRTVNRTWLGDVDSNHDKQSQSLLSYR